MSNIEDELLLVDSNPDYNLSDEAIEIIDSDIISKATKLFNYQPTKTSPSSVLKLERANFAVRLRVMGYNFDDIASAVKAKYGNLVSTKYTAITAHADVKFAMDNIRKNLSENTQDLISRSTMMLDQLSSAIMPRALSGDLKAIDRILNIEERRAKLHGLDKPSKIEVHDWRSELLSLLQQGKITIQQVQNELGDGYARELSDKLIVAGGANFLESGNVEEGSFTESGEQVA